MHIYAYGCTPLLVIMFLWSRPWWRRPGGTGALCLESAMPRLILYVHSPRGVSGRVTESPTDGKRCPLETRET